MNDNTRKYLNKEIELCNQIWDEHLRDGNNELDHFHICDFQLLSMIRRYKKSFRKYNNEWEKLCIDYLHSIGHERDEYMECCDCCPHMRYLTLSEDNYFLNIASVGMDKFIFDEEK